MRTHFLCRCVSFYIISSVPSCHDCQSPQTTVNLWTAVLARILENLHQHVSKEALSIVQEECWVSIRAANDTSVSTSTCLRAASFSPRLKNRRVRLLLSLFESPALCVMLTHLCEDLSVLCSLMHFAVTSASACVAPASCLGVSQHHHHCTESSNQSTLLYSDYIWELSSDSNYYQIVLVVNF